MSLESYQKIWRQKPVLKIVYDDFYRRISGVCVDGRTIEIGGGIGNLKEHINDVVATDIQFAPWLDCLADAQRLPFADASAANIVMVDVLHHVEFPALFFRDAERVLKLAGRIIMVEPAVTWGSTLFYRLLHHEPVRMSADPLTSGVADPGRDPYDSNQAIPSLIATRHRAQFHRLFPRLRIVRADWFSFFAYPLSGGFKPWSLISAPVAAWMLRIENAIEPSFGRIAGFRMMLVIEKIASSVKR